MSKRKTLDDATHRSDLRKLIADHPDCSQVLNEVYRPSPRKVLTYAEAFEHLTGRPEPFTALEVWDELTLHLQLGDFPPGVTPKNAMLRERLAIAFVKAVERYVERQVGHHHHQSLEDAFGELRL